MLERLVQTVKAIIKIKYETGEFIRSNRFKQRELVRKNKCQNCLNTTSKGEGFLSDNIYLFTYTMASLILLKSMLLTKALHKQKKKIKKRARYWNKFDTSMCRVCGDSKANNPIFDGNNDCPLASEIQNFSGVVITKADKFSTKMCQNCLDLLNGCILFRDLCQQTDKDLRERSHLIRSECSPAEDHITEVRSLDTPSPVISDDPSENSTQMKISDDPDIIECEVCLEQFGTLALFDNHLAACKPIKIRKKTRNPPVEVVKKTFLCETCGKQAPSHAGLLVHMSTHENVFRYKCDACPYQGRTSDLLKVHKRSHLADKPYKCTQCPKACTTSSNLAKHMRHVHTTARPFKCNYCDRQFSYQHDVKRHVRDIHLRQGTAECDICRKKFNTKKILQGHRSKIHKLKSERSGRLPSYLLCRMEDQTNAPGDDDYDCIDGLSTTDRYRPRGVEATH